VPKVEVKQAKKIVSAIVKAIDMGCVKACHDLSEGGLAVAAAEMAFAGGFGIDLWLKKVPKPIGMRRNDFILFSESNSRFLVEVSEKGKQVFEDLMRGVVFSMIGRVRNDSHFIVYGLNDEKLIDISLTALRRAWKSTLGGD
jgi:phosphoribosylformylglycinamidine synthase